MKKMINSLVVFLVFGLAFNLAKAQDKPRIKGSYFDKNKLSFLSGGNNYKDDKGVSLTTIHGVHLSEHFASGIGVGLTDGQKYASPTIPVFLNGTLLVAQMRKLYLSGDLGYSIAIEKRIKGGLLGEISAGWKFRIGRIAIAPEIGYRYDGYKVRGLEMVELNGNYIIRNSDTYFSQHINSFSTGISVFL